MLNAANEVGVAAFLAGTIRFTAIHTVNVETLQRLDPQLGAEHRLEDLIALDERARAVAREVMQELAA